MTTLDKFRRKAAADPLLRSVRRKAEAGTADFHDTARYSERAAQILGETLSADILSTPHGERAGACEALLHEQYADTCELLCDVQEVLDAETGLYIAPQVPEYPEERVEQVAQSLEDETVPDETIERRARSAPENVAKAFHDAYMRENAKFRSSAGVKCQIVREGNGCCPWCAEIAGKYEYGDEPDDVYRRHDNCTCTVIFENGKQRQDVWSKRTWEAPASDAGAGDPTVFTDEDRPTGFVPHILTGGEKSGTIKSIDVDDYYTVTYGKGILKEVSELILNTMKQCEKDGGFLISEISNRVIPTSLHGTPVLQIEMMPNGLLRLNINADYLAGKTISEIDDAFLHTESTVVNSLMEAVIHESGHAISIYRLTPQQVEKLYKQLVGAGLPGVSDIALADGAECLAELEVLRSRGVEIAEYLAEFYRKYMGRDYS